MKGKPERKAKEPEEAPKPKKPPEKPSFFRKHPVLTALGTAAALKASACAPAARAQTPTTPSTPTTLQSPDVRAASAEARTPSEGRPSAAPARPRPDLVAQAATTTPTTASDTTSAGSAAQNPTDRVYEIGPNEQPQIISGEEFRRDFGYMFENRNATLVDLPATGKITLGDWEVEVFPNRTQFSDIKIRNKNLNYEKSSTASRGAKLILFPFPETEYTRGPMFGLADTVATSVYFFNKLGECVTEHIFGYPVFPSGPPEVGTDVFQNEPYVVIAPPGSITANRDALPGTWLVQYSLFTHLLDVNGPTGGTGYFVRSRE